MQATRSFEATLVLDNKNVTIKVSKGQNIKDLVHHLVQLHNLPTHVTVSIYSTLVSAMTCSIDGEQENSSKKELRQLFMDAYQSNTLQYNNKPEEDIFPRAYHTLVHCPIATLFDTLIELEQSYAIAIQELLETSENEFIAIQERQALEIETNNTNRQVQEMKAFQLNWQTEISNTEQTQRQEYREFVIELYREYQSRLSTLPDDKQQDDTLAMSKLDGKEMVATAANRVRRFEPKKNASVKSTESVQQSPAMMNRKRTGSLASSLGSVQTDLVRTVSQPEFVESSTSTHSIEFKKSVKSIQEMGFAKEQAETALVISNQNTEAAICLLIENPTKVDAYIAEKALLKPPASSSTPYRRSHSLSQVPRPNIIASPPSSVRNDRRHSLQRLSTTPTFLNITSSKLPNKSWNPISFLQQQKQNMENTNISSMKKLGGWLGKAIETFGPEHDERVQSNNVPQLAESFTIMMGTTQIKSSHNLRLLVIDESTELFNPLYDPPRERAYRAETATKLYTSHLSAAIVLVSLNGWEHYKSGKKSNQALFERCQQSTEFHFSDIESQISLIEQDFEQSGGRVEGSFFVTKHSNLPSTQVVFHLFIDSEAVTTTDLSNRHNLMIGLRNILKMTTQFDISSISIPLLLLPDRFNEKHDSQWLQKRGEVVMKCIKGYLIENSRSGKRVQNEGLDRAESMGGGGMRNIEFLLPKKPDVYGPIMTTEPTTTGVLPQEVEVAFQQFRALLVHLFRAS